MQWLDQIVPQDIERTWSNDECTETGMEHDEDSRGDKYNGYRDGGNNLKSKHQQ